jgi:hypothetical protein
MHLGGMLGVDIVIPYTKDKHKGLELKYALRSIEKFFDCDVWVIGDKPKFDIKHLPCSDGERKEFNIANKILTACKCEQISEDFIMYHDDHFQLKETEIKYWHDGDLQRAHDRARGLYQKALKNTIDIGCKLNYDIHTPIVFNKEKFREVMKAPWGPDREFCVKSLYCKGMKGEYMEDLKLNAPYPLNRIWEKLEGRTFFSTGNYAMTPDMIEVLETLYPEPSRWEIEIYE